MHIALRDTVRVKHVVGAVDLFLTFALRGLRDTTVDDDMADVDILRMEFPRERLAQAAQTEFSHSESCRISEAFDTSRRASEQHRAASCLQHAVTGVMRHQESAIVPPVGWISRSGRPQSCIHQRLDLRLTRLCNNTAQFLITFQHDKRRPARDIHTLDQIGLTVFIPIDIDECNLGRVVGVVSFQRVDDPFLCRAGTAPAGLEIQK